MFQSDDIEGISDFLALVKKGEPWTIPTERLIRLNGNQKRGRYVNESINRRLEELGLVCKPSIENADFYGSVVVSDPRDDLPEHMDTAALPLSAFPSEFGDLIYCGPDMPLPKVLSLLIMQDISQLPVLSSDKRTVRGVVTWRSIGEAATSSYQASGAKAKDVMINAGHIASSSDDFLDLVDAIIEQEYILYRTPSGEVNGIVTASDLARAFEGTAGLYIKLQELENRIRILLDRSPIPKLKCHLEPKRRNKKNFRGASDMMFGEYIAALKDPEIWNSTRITFDQEHLVAQLEKVREVRNDVMHFATSSTKLGGDNSENDTIVTKALRLFRAVPLT